jgi:HTH-type transcriptional regulator/antitoxin HigA
MDLRPIRNKRDYIAALKEVESLWGALTGSEQADRLDVLVMLIQTYEEKQFPIADPDPIDFIHHLMDARGLNRKDLETYIGSRARVSEILNRTRPLTLEMIRRLSDGLNVPADILVRRYPLTEAA